MIKIKDQIKKLTKNIQEEIEEMHYNINESAPWFKLYEKVPKTVNVPKKTMYEMIEYTASMYPDNYAYEYYGKKVTYTEFMQKISRCAKALKAIGVKENDFVSICMPNTPEGIVAVYAVNMIGAVANMIHPLSSEAEIEFYVNKAKSKYIISMDFVYDKLMNIKNHTQLEKIVLCKANDDMKIVMSMAYYLTSGRKIKVKNKPDYVMMWKDFIYLGRDNEENVKVDKKDTDLAVVLYSGGTTGTPKGIKLSNRNFNAIAEENIAVCEGAVAGASMLSIMPIFHGFGLAICFHTALVVGMECIIIPKFNLKEFAKLIKTYRPNLILGVPTLFEGLLTAELKEDDLECVTTVLCGGDLLTSALREKVNQYLHEHGSKTEVMVGYGMTECCASVIFTPLAHYKDGSIGVPEPNNYVKICKPNTTENLFYNEDGEICIYGPSVMMGYLDDEEETKMALRKHDDGKVWLHTGDMGSMDKNGIIYFKSRIKRMIISSGYNIYPSYVENVINTHPAVLTSIVVGFPDNYRGEVAKAFIVLRAGNEPTDELKTEIKEFCKKQIAKYSMPVSFEFREELPKTKINKVDYRALQNEQK